MQDLKTRLASQTSIAQILYLQGQGDDPIDEAITLIEAPLRLLLPSPRRLPSPVLPPYQCTPASPTSQRPWR